jgi:hypothetical protein
VGVIVGIKYGKAVCKTIENYNKIKFFITFVAVKRKLSTIKA